MTDLEFATCDLDRLSEIINNPERKHFSELQPGDKVYCVKVTLREALGLVRSLNLYEKFELPFYQSQLVTPHKPRSRKMKVYLTPTRGFIADKYSSAFIRFKEITKYSKYIQVYGTTLEECIFKAEKALDIKYLEHKLIWTEANI